MDFELQMKATEVKKASSELSEDEEGEDNKEGSVAFTPVKGLVLKDRRCHAHALMRELMIWIHSCIDLRYMQIVKDAVKDSGQCICQHY